MPSANPKLEKQASQEAAEPIRQAITVIEHKIRNLEKRKGKLESYKDLQNNGKDLDPDQKMAVAKYDVVVQLLDNTRDMYKQIVGIANEATKQQKKLARKEAAERLQQDIAKVREVLVIKETLSRIGIENIRGDFLAGTNGAIKLTEEDLKYLDDFYNETTVNHQRQENCPSMQQQVQKVAEHFIAIVDGKQREIVGTTYNKIKKIVSSIYECGYFDRVQSSETVEEKEIEEPINEEFGTGERHIPPPENMMPMPNFPGVPVAAVPVVSGTAAVPVVAQPIPPPVETSFYTNAPGFVPPPPQTQAGATIAPAQQPNQPNQQPAPRINDVIGTPNFFFLQESELDSPEVTTQTPIVSHIPPTVNAPIPTQTFTNQSFTGPPVVAPAVIYPHQPPQDMSHIPGFTNPNPPPPIPMPPSHQQPNLQFSPQHPGGFPQDQSIIQQGTPFEAHHQDNEAQKNDIKSSADQNDTSVQNDHGTTNEVTEWSADTDVNTNDWNQPDDAQQSQDSQSQPQQGWGEQRSSGFRGRGNRRGSSSNGYGGRSRSGGFQQNSRGGNAGGGGGQGSHYRSENSSYQNGYHQRWSNFTSGNGGGGGGGNGTNSTSGGYSNGFKSRTGGGPRGSGAGVRGERNTERGEGRSSGQFRGGQQRGGSRGGYAARSKPQTQQ